MTATISREFVASPQILLSGAKGDVSITRGASALAVFLPEIAVNR